MIRHNKRHRGFHSLLFILYCMTTSVFAQSPLQTNSHDPSDLASSNKTNDPSSESVNTDHLSKESQSTTPFYPQRLKPYSATYQAYDGDKKVGSAHRKLTINNKRWQLNMMLIAEKWFFDYQLTENSIFTLENNLLMSKFYYSLTQKSFKDNLTINQSFNWKTGIESGSYKNKSWHIPINTPLSDHLNYQIALQLSVTPTSTSITIPMSYKGKQYDYHFTNEGEVNVKTPLGDFKTFKLVQQTDDDKGKYVILWLAPKLQFIPVQMEQMKNGKQEAILKIKRLDWE